MAAVHQLVAGFSRGDAISNEAFELRRIFREWGFSSEIFCETKRILPELRREARDIGEYVPAAMDRDIVILHLSIGSPLNRVFGTLPGRKVVLYHNVTPASYFRLVNARTATLLETGRRELASLAGAADLVLADSRFNAGELEQLGCRGVRVLPLVVDFGMIEGASDRKTLRTYSDGKTNVLFVGRCVPNKCIEDAITTFYYFHETVDADSRFLHAGSFAGSERYHALLLTQARDLGLEDVELLGAVPQDRLNALFRSASVFLCMSEHEGFCIPILEAMALDVPVVAFAGGAVEETMAGAGVLVREKRHAEIAEMLGAVTRDGPFRRAVVEGQRKRVAHYRAFDAEETLRELLTPVLEGFG